MGIGSVLRRRVSVFYVLAGALIFMMAGQSTGNAAEKNNKTKYSASQLQQVVDEAYAKFKDDKDKWAKGKVKKGPYDDEADGKTYENCYQMTKLDWRQVMYWCCGVRKKTWRQRKSNYYRDSIIK